MRTIAVLVDFSDATPAVVKTASEMARALGAGLSLLHASLPEAQYVGTTDAGGLVLDPVAVDADLRDAQTRLTELANRLRAEGFEVHAKLLHGPAADEIVRETGQLTPDLIVAGSHGHGALYHLIMGSVTSAVLRKSSCPVLVVPHRGKR